MSDRNQMEKTLRQAYAVRQNGKLDDVVNLFTPDARFALAGTAEVSPVVMQVAGTSQLRSALDTIVNTFILLDHQILNMLIDGDRAAVHWRARFKSPTSGQVLETELCDLIEVKDGRIASFYEFCDTAAAARFMSHAA